MRKFVAVLIVLACLAAAVYFGVVFMLVGGIEEIVHACQMHPVLVNNIVWGGVRVLFAGSAGFIAWLGGALALLIWPEKIITLSARERITKGL